MNAIQFRGITPENKNIKTNVNTLTPIVVKDLNPDTFEMSATLETKEKKSFLEKVSEMFDTNGPRKAGKILRAKANSVMSESIVLRDETYKILKIATTPNKAHYIKHMEKKGMQIRFGKDNEGRRTLIIKDLDGNLIKRAAFDEKTKNLIYIEMPTKNGKKVDRIDFLNSTGTRFEVKLGYKQEKDEFPAMKEYYKFINGHPVEYAKNCVDFDGVIDSENEYIF